MEIPGSRLKTQNYFNPKIIIHRAFSHIRHHCDEDDAEMSSTRDPRDYSRDPSAAPTNHLPSIVIPQPSFETSKTSTSTSPLQRSPISPPPPSPPASRTATTMAPSTLIAARALPRAATRVSPILAASRAVAVRGYATPKGPPPTGFRQSKRVEWHWDKDSLLDRMGKYFLLSEMARGMYLLLEQFFRPP